MSKDMKTIKIPIQVWRAMKIAAAKRGVPMYELITIESLEAKKRESE